MISALLDGYRHHIVDAHKQPLFLLLVGFITSFAFIRFSTRMIRAQVRWWPGNITPGGLHIHHMVFGLGFLLLGGIGTFATDGGHPWTDWFGLSFGIGCGLVLDEFALILHLDDVYWSEQGRKSVDAVILGILLTALLLTGYVPLGVVPGQDTRWGLVAVIGVNALVCLVALLKGKVWTGLLGIMVPGLSWIGAIRLARPASPWARWRYAGRPRRMARAARRERRLHARTDRARTWLFDLIAGAPDKVPAGHPKAHAVAERMAAKALAHRYRPGRGGRVGGPGGPGAGGRADGAEAAGGDPARRARAQRRRRTVRAGRARTTATGPGRPSGRPSGRVR
ncbi:hypothetical protein OU787_13985 [Kitasatospora sp. YST-16]|uniref:hypothetical protein n=1 Tax=Kitasatospora sp. YST-16 TaxID=2998080 RepID=UPI002285373E|nr:hypothetical protein [Kitasatospora sp. YST-16]WAL72516.1 hypothetical protein OU787_13985 [Kitasatospora sp. YST-16]WNW38567.1 hypothetical protein RKE32_13945 [Streptomyces sp. Li-HN-5-13]